MRFESYPQTASIPNIIVDGPANGATVLALSHWSRSGTPRELRADTSTEIVFNYFDTPRFHVQVDAVSNNHFDEDGLLGIFALLNPSSAERHRDLLIDASRAGDFGVYERRDAARIATVERSAPAWQQFRGIASSLSTDTKAGSRWRRGAPCFASTCQG